jgi:hypothetical protein
VKAQLMRTTLHAVHAEDYPAFHNAMWYPLRASAADFTQFTIVPRSRTRKAFAALDDELVHLVGPDGKELLDVPGAPLPDEAWDGLAAEAAALVPFLAGRDPAVYRRYAR